MKTIKNIKIAVLTLLLGLFAGSCIENVIEPMGDEGQTIIRLTPSSTTGFFFRVAEGTSQPQTFALIDVRRDLPNEAALNSTTVVTLKFDQAIMTTYNTANSKNFIPIPSNLYTTSPASTGGNIVMTFGPGEFAKQLYLTIPNALLLDPANQYALAYKMEVTSGPGILSESSNDELVVQVMPKNLYDGLYQVTAVNPMIDYVAATLVGHYPFVYALETTGAYTVECYEMPGRYSRHLILNSTTGNLSLYGNFAPKLTFKSDGSHEIEAVTSYLAPGGLGRGGALADDGDNEWDPDTKDIYVKYWLTQTVNNSSPHYPGRTLFDEKWIYLGPR